MKCQPLSSGSIVVCHPVNGDPVAVGLVFAVSPDLSLSFVASLDIILNKFGVNIISGHNI